MEQPRLAIVLAGGSGRRLGLVDKPALLVGGVSLLTIALTAVAPARTVVVGPQRTLPAGVRQTREHPPGGGPAAGLVAGLAALVMADGVGAAGSAGLGTADGADPGPAAADSAFCETDLVAVLAADLPGIDAVHIRSLTAALIRERVDGAVLVDADGRSQYLAGVWRLTPLLRAARSRPDWQGGRVSDLLGPLIGVRVAAGRAAVADVDTTADLAEWQVDRPPSSNNDGQ